MAKFISGSALNSHLESIIKNASKQLLLVSPYIKLHARLIDEMNDRKEDDKLEIKILFGKNEDILIKSLPQKDFEFLRTFPNIEIRYNARLHAKYYGNDDTGLITSMNLYDFSQDKNIEAGVLVKSSLMNIVGLTGGDLDYDAAEYFTSLFERSKLMYKNSPKYEKKLLGSDKYLGFEMDEDNLSMMYGQLQDKTTKTGPKRVPYTSSNATKHAQHHSDVPGYCIRTGKQIPFNPKKPFTDEAYQSWARYGNEDFREKFCHFSGEPSNGETTKAKPILRKNWTKAKGRS